MDIIGLVFAIIAMQKKDRPKGAATAGLVLSIIGIIIFLGMLFV